MNASKIDVDYVARLARLELSSQEKVVFEEQLEKIVDYCSIITSVNLEGVPPMIHAFEESENVWCEDIPCDSWPTEVALKNAPEIKENQIVVPRVI